MPAYGRDFGYTLDLMRHDPDAPNGMTEFLISNAAAALRERGVIRLSMNFAAWGRLLDPECSTRPTQRFATWWIRKLNPFFQIESLRSFNQKFDPEWLPRAWSSPSRPTFPASGSCTSAPKASSRFPASGQLLVPKPVGGVLAPDDARARRDRDPRSRDRRASTAAAAVGVALAILSACPAAGRADFDTERLVRRARPRCATGGTRDLHRVA